MHNAPKTTLREGISLKNVRYVHIIEPYWHPVRIEQVIGRARRICSHHSLPSAEREIRVFLYLMTFSEDFITNDKISIELKLHDVSKLDKKTPITTDEALFEIDDTINKNPDIVKNAPTNTPVTRLDETKANRELNLRWKNEI